MRLSSFDTRALFAPCLLLALCLATTIATAKEPPLRMTETFKDGMATALQAGLPEIIFGGSGAPLPESFAVYPARLVHGVIATLLMIQVVVHVAGALYHQVVLKDRLLSRMGFGKRQAN